MLLVLKEHLRDATQQKPRHLLSFSENALFCRFYQYSMHKTGACNAYVTSILEAEPICGHEEFPKLAETKPQFLTNNRP